jgi:adenosylcobyric acid synthase
VIDGAPEGARRGPVSGTYLHGVFASDAFRQSFLNGLGDPVLNYEAGVEAALDGLAAHLERHLDLDQLLSFAAAV